MAELEPRNFLQPCLLLLLCEKADHGYELVSRLRPMHDGDGDAGGIYRALRGMERQGLVNSVWSASGSGPAKRTYSITPEGVAYLHELAAGLEHTHAVLHVFLDRYAGVCAASRNGRSEGSTHDRRADERRRHNGFPTPRRPHEPAVR
ncbi:PadR family transcriptional regulator [Pseudonocardia sp. TRM90224]|uniref:PadR family transcriptional regulator n=1 Tax=Pseudonocardia sp. TRM90224 TaxID=2812678 RepID=UPI001E3FE05A|nr:PadR family transcriptional regulator [Pseudonocardia sp. TRM90224]